MASIAKSVGLTNASRPLSKSFCFFVKVPFLEAVFDIISATGTLAYTLIPNSSNCSGDSIPRLRKTRSSTIHIEITPPR